MNDRLTGQKVQVSVRSQTARADPEAVFNAEMRNNSGIDQQTGR